MIADALLPVTSWGRLGYFPHNIVPLNSAEMALPVLPQSTPGIAYGMGRSYGDICLNPEGILWQTRALNRFIEFDSDTGRITCQAGVLLQDIQRLSMPRGWMLPVTPGTQLVTVGGAIANDIHGKNQHQFGTFGHHIHALTLMRTDGQTLKCTRDERPDLLRATIGGMGLTGVIRDVVIQLKRMPGPWLHVEKIPYTSLDEFFALSDDSYNDWEYTVSWIDCSKRGVRGIFLRAKSVDEVHDMHPPKERVLSVPLDLPFRPLNALTLRIFNTMYYRFHAFKAGKFYQHYTQFLYPLDRILDWNKLYGPCGFYQYQALIPHAYRHAAVACLLATIARSRQGSFLNVLKTFGKHPSAGLMSFPAHGVTLAMDFPNLGAATRDLFFRLDAIVQEAGGRIYPAKDICMSPDLFEAGYPELNTFLTYRDPGISSALSRRLMGY